MKVGKTNTERGPMVGREQREEVVDRRAVSTTQIHTIVTHARTHKDMSTETVNTQYGSIREGNM